ncbi:hypothetical protein BC826DRAFT_1111339 [Russula brevipes]|nr:hypothetical protein BC826DRAFT_1111339 [Russula brevipes]
MPSYPAGVTRLLGQTIDNGALRIEAILRSWLGLLPDPRNSTPRACFIPPHVLTFHREIDAGFFAFFVYDLCAGDLHTVIRKLTLFREDELIKRVFIQIIDALSIAIPVGLPPGSEARERPGLFPQWRHRRVHRGLWSCNHEQDDGIFLRNTVFHEPRYASPHMGALSCR